MRISRRLRLTALVYVGFALLVAALGARAEEPWHDYSLRAYGGYVENAANVDARDTYMKLRMGSAAEFGAAFVVAINRSFDLDMGLSHMRADATQRNASGSGNEQNTLSINMAVTRFRITGKLRYNKHEGNFVPWIGLGVNAGLISCDEAEKLYSGGGYILREREETSSAFGFHGAAGFDIYPVKSSSLAMTFEARYQIDAAISGPFKGSLDGAAFLAGIKWDFWPSTTYRFKSQ